MSVLALAPCAQPAVQWARLMHFARALRNPPSDRAVRRPPVPPQLVQPARQRRAGFAQRQRRHHRFMRRIGRIARQAGHAHHAIVLIVERLQRRVVDRPVVGHAVQRAHAKIRWMEAGEMAGVQNGAAADSVEIGYLDRRVVPVDRIVRLARRAVRIVIEIAETAAPPSRVLCWGIPMASSSRLAPGKRCASSSRRGSRRRPRRMRPRR